MLLITPPIDGGRHNVQLAFERRNDRYIHIIRRRIRIAVIDH